MAFRQIQHFVWSCLFRPCTLVRCFPVLRFPSPRVGLLKASRMRLWTTASETRRLRDCRWNELRATPMRSIDVTAANRQWCWSCCCCCCCRGWRPSSWSRRSPLGCSCAPRSETLSTSARTCAAEMTRRCCQRRAITSEIINNITEQVANAQYAGTGSASYSQREGKWVVAYWCGLSDVQHVAGYVSYAVATTTIRLRFDGRSTANQRSLR